MCEECRDICGPSEIIEELAAKLKVMNETVIAQEHAWNAQVEQMAAALVAARALAMADAAKLCDEVDEESIEPIL